jgi:hypothetical protein
MSPLTSADDSSPDTHPDQSEIECGDPIPSNAQGQTCEWCDEGAIEAIEIQAKLGRGIVRTGTFIYACGRHTTLAHQIVAEKVAPRTRKKDDDE